MTVDEQIEYLNTTVKCTLKPSPIHGIGVFALRDIGKGEAFMYYSGQEFTIPMERFHELREDVRTLILDRWPQIKGGRVFRSPDEDQILYSFMNHSDTPNSQDGVAIRDIKAGEEVTEDYDTGNLTEVQKQHYNFLK